MQRRPPTVDILGVTHRLAALLLPLACNTAGDATPANTDASDSTAAPSTASGDGGIASSADVTEDSGRTDTGVTTGSISDDTGSSSGDGPATCIDDDDCLSADAAFCVEQVCSSCSMTDDPDGHCAEKFPDTPACVGAVCVPCSASETSLCTGETPLCDVEANACVACTSHDQCPGEAACDLYTGACFPENAVFYVDEDNAACSDAGPGTEAMPWCGIESHVENLGIGQFATFYLAEHPDGSTYRENIIVEGNRRVALLAYADGTPHLRPNTADHIISISSTSGTVYLHGIRLTTSSSAPAIHLENNGSLWASSSQIVQNSGGGIEATGGSTVTLVNSMVGAAVDDVVAVSLNDANANIFYSTLGAASFSARALQCVSPGTVTVRNSLLVTRGGTPGDEIDCSGADITYSATEGNTPGEGNANVGGFPGGTPQDWFVDFTGGDYRLQNQGITVFADIAQWQTGDPSTDIDGDARPNTDGAADYAGADVP